MDEIACPDRVLSGDHLCVDCCAIGDYLLLAGQDMCGVGHHDIVSFDQKEWQEIAQQNGKLLKSTCRHGKHSMTLWLRIGY